MKEQSLTLILIDPGGPKFHGWQKYSLICMPSHGPSHYARTSCPKRTGKSTTLTWTGWLSGPGPLKRANLNTLGLPPTCYCYYSEGWSLFCMLPLWLQVACVWRVVRGLPANIISVLSHWCFGLLAAIAACHVGFDGTTVGQHTLIFS